MTNRVDREAAGSGGGLRRRTLLGWAFSGVALGVLAACREVPAATPAATPVPATQAPAAPQAAATAAPPAAVSTPTSAPQAAAGAPRSGGTLRWAIGSDIANLDGHQLTSTQYETVFRAYDRLTALDAQGRPQPQLAESWELNSDAKQLKLNLRHGVQFHSGRELTSEDVKWNILRVRDPKIASGSFVGQSDWFTHLETPDKYTLIATFESPRPAIFDLFQLMNVLDPVTMQGAEAATKVVGTGPSD